MKRIFEGFRWFSTTGDRSFNPLPMLPHSSLPVKEHLFLIKMPEDPTCLQISAVTLIDSPQLFPPFLS